MRIRSVLLACVCTAFLAAPAAVGGTIATNQNSVDLAAAARSALQAGNLETAIAGYSEAIEARDLAPEQLANALINRGYAYQQAGEHDRAVDEETGEYITSETFFGFSLMSRFTSSQALR